jgi:tetratricopeptide (TPR) repeat protein
LWRALGSGAVYAVLGDVLALEGAVKSAVDLAPGTALVLQAEGILASLKGDTKGALSKAQEALDATSTDAASGRAQLGLARTMLAVGATDPAVGAEGMQLFEDMAKYGRDPDAHLQLAAELGEKGVSSVFEHLAAAFVARPRDPSAMRELMQVFRTHGWPVGVGLVARHMRQDATTPDIRLISHLVDLAVGVYLKGASWGGLLPFADADYHSAMQASAEFSGLVRCTVASLLIDHGRFQDAGRLLTEITTVLGTPEGYAHHAFMEGRLEQAKGNFPAAVEHYARAFDIEPSHLDAACNFVDLTFTQPTPEALEAIGAVLLAIPIVARRNHLQLSYNEALWREARGETVEALKVADALLEGPLGGLAAHVGTLRARLLQAGATA